MVKSKVKVIVISGFGLNCEAETAAAFALVGAEVSKVHLNDLLAGKFKLKDFHIMALIGGFSFGDHLGAGTILANRLKLKLGKQLKQFVAAGKLIIGICNGFQVLTRLGLLPNLGDNEFEQQVALDHNDCGTFRNDWVHVKANPNSPSVFTKNIDSIRLPIRHGEGKFVAPEAVFKQLQEKNMIALQYANQDGSIANSFPQNPNGSLGAVAGICSENGRILGLMPHPEAFLSPYNSPTWTRDKALGKLAKEGEGVIFFRNAVEFVANQMLSDMYSQNP